MCSRRHSSLRDKLSHSDAARYTFDLAFDRLIKVAFVAHPSLLKRLHDLLVRLTRSAVRRGSVARVGGPDPGRRAKVQALVRFPSVGLKTPSERFH
jgi:hypothetical protein